MKRGETFLPEFFQLSESTCTWLSQRYPAIDGGETLAIFCDKALARGWRYRDWQAAFRNYIRNAMRFGGVAYKQIARDMDPKWQTVLHEARKAGFREPRELETPGGYRTELEQWQRDPQRRNVLTLRAQSVLKRVPH